MGTEPTGIASSLILGGLRSATATGTRHPLATTGGLGFDLHEFRGPPESMGLQHPPLVFGRNDVPLAHLLEPAIVLQLLDRSSHCLSRGSNHIGDLLMSQWWREQAVIVG